MVDPPVPSVNAVSLIGQRLRALAFRTTDPELAHLAREVEALEDRVTFCEAARHHDRADLDRLLALLTVSVAETAVPL